MEDKYFLCDDILRTIVSQLTLFDYVRLKSTCKTYYHNNNILPQEFKQHDYLFHNTPEHDLTKLREWIKNDNPLKLELVYQYNCMKPFKNSITNFIQLNVEHISIYAFESNLIYRNTFSSVIKCTCKILEFDVKNIRLHSTDFYHILNCCTNLISLECALPVLCGPKHHKQYKSLKSFTTISDFALDFEIMSMVCPNIETICIKNGYLLYIPFGLYQLVSFHNLRHIQLHKKIDYYLSPENPDNVRELLSQIETIKVASDCDLKFIREINSKVIATKWNTNTMM